MPREMYSGESYPELHIRVSNANGFVDMSTATAITVGGKKGSTPIGPLTATADSPQSDPAVKGWITAPIATTDTAIDGEFIIVVKVTWAVGQVSYFGPETLNVLVNPHP